jgi:hypothetical protein
MQFPLVSGSHAVTRAAGRSVAERGFGPQGRHAKGTAEYTTPAGADLRAAADVLSLLAPDSRVRPLNLTDSGSALLVSSRLGADTVDSRDGQNPADGRNVLFEGGFPER